MVITFISTSFRIYFDFITFEHLIPGALRVQNLTLRDSGRYTCIAGRSSASIQISVRPKPGEFVTSEEIQRQGSNKNERVDLISDVYINRDDTSPIFSSDDHSHEQRPDVVRKKPTRLPTPRTGLFTPTLPSLRKDNNLDAWPPQATTLNTDSVHVSSIYFNFLLVV